MIRAAVRALDRRTGSAGLLRSALRYVFPDHWSFLLGEIALYAFVVLVATGVYLALFFEPSVSETVYDGSYAPLRGERVSEAYSSAVEISLDVPAGLLLRQTHHWAANVFVAAIVLHLLRVFFTGAYRRPRRLTYHVGVTLLALSLLQGYLGYSMLDDLFSGMGLAIGYSVLLGVPVIGAQLASWVWGGPFPGADEWISRFYVGHVFLLPALLGLLMAIHLALVVRARHTDFPRRGAGERRVVGTPLWPARLLRSTGLLLGTGAVLVLLGGLVQINPVWQWGPYEPWLSTNGARPDWYLGWLIGGLRIMPPWELVIGGVTLAPNPFFGGVLLPLLVFGGLYLWPAAERLVTGDRGEHHVLERPRERPMRTAVGVAAITWLVVIFGFGASDRLLLGTGVSYGTQLVTARVLVIVLPVAAFLVTWRACVELRRSGMHPFRGPGRQGGPSPATDERS